MQNKPYTQASLSAFYYIQHIMQPSISKESEDAKMLRDTYIYGTGNCGILTFLNLKAQGIISKAFIDENADQIEIKTKLPILKLSQVLSGETKPYIVIADANAKTIKETIDTLEQHGLKEKEDFDLSIFAQFYYDPHKFIFVIYAPPYDDNSGGSVVLHQLHKLLLKHGFNSKICIWGGGDYLPPIASSNAIVLYPEVIDGNPLKAKSIARWLLNKPKALDSNVNFTENELTFCYHKDFNDINLNPEENTLYIFYNRWETYKQTNFGNRNGFCYIIRKGQNRKDLPKTFNGPVIDGKSHEEIAKIFNECKYLISYDTHTAYTIYARMCGCLPIVIPDNSANAVPMTKYPFIAYAYSSKAISRAKKAEKEFNEYLQSMKEDEKDNDRQVLNFVEISKKRFLNHNPSA